MLKARITASPLWQPLLSQGIPVPKVSGIQLLNQTLQTKLQTYSIENETEYVPLQQVSHHIHMLNFLEHYHYEVGRTFR